jgi:hypothetical protein
VVYCGCFFDKACQQLMRLVAEYNKPYIAVCYTADNEKIKNNATDAAGSGFAKQVSQLDSIVCFTAQPNLQLCSLRHGPV